MALPPRPMGSLTDSGIEAPQGMEVEIPQAPDFAGGAEVVQQPDGSAIVQALMGGVADGLEVETEQYDHMANLAEIIDDDVLGEISPTSVVCTKKTWSLARLKAASGLIFLVSSIKSAPSHSRAHLVTHPLIAESVTQFKRKPIKNSPAGGPVKHRCIPRPWRRKRRPSREELHELSGHEVWRSLILTRSDAVLSAAVGSTFKGLLDPTKARAVSLCARRRSAAVLCHRSEHSTACNSYSSYGWQPAS